MNLILGCGNRKGWQWPFDFSVVDSGGLKLIDLDFPDNCVRIDIDPDCHPDIIWDLNNMPWPVDSSSCDQIYAFEILEHFGSQGDAKSFFDAFKEIHRILVPGGTIYISCPHWSSQWAWGDPGHRRIVGLESIVFLNQKNYTEVGSTMMTDYRKMHWPKEYTFESVDRFIIGAPGEQTTFFSLRKPNGLEPRRGPIN